MTERWKWTNIHNVQEGDHCNDKQEDEMTACEVLQRALTLTIQLWHTYSATMSKTAIAIPQCRPGKFQIFCLYQASTLSTAHHWCDRLLTELQLRLLIHAIATMQVSSNEHWMSMDVSLIEIIRVQMMTIAAHHVRYLSHGHKNQNISLSLSPASNDSY